MIFPLRVILNEEDGMRNLLRKLFRRAKSIKSDPIGSVLTFAGLLLGCMTITSAVSAATLAKGDCADPQPYTDLNHCRFRGTDLRNKNLVGTDLRQAQFNKTQLQGADLTNALIDGRGITYAFLDGVRGLPEEALAILKNRYLVTRKSKTDLSISLLSPDYVTKNMMSIAGLDNIFAASKVAGTQNTIALLSLPRYGTFEAVIVARFEDNKLDMPKCYQSWQPYNDNNSYYNPLVDSMIVIPLKNGGYGIGIKISGSDGDDLGVSAWDKIAMLELSNACKLTLLHEEYQGRAADVPVKNQGIEWGSGGKLDFRLMDDETVEIKTTIWITAPPKKTSTKILYKRLKLTSHH